MSAATAGAPARAVNAAILIKCIFMASSFGVRWSKLIRQAEVGGVSAETDRGRGDQGCGRAAKARPKSAGAGPHIGGRPGAEIRVAIFGAHDPVRRDHGFKAAAY